MANISQVRGALLEEAVLYLLEKFGYKTIEVVPGHQDRSIRSGHSGLEVRGRGSWHQIDALASFKSSPAFMYPLRLIVEAKCYKEHRTVGIEVVRNAVGVLKDISENYFSVPSGGADIQVPRFNYHSAIFSASGYTRSAINYALAHQIFLIQYENVPVIRPLIDSIKQFDENCITTLGKGSISEVRKQYRRIIRGQISEVNILHFITYRGLELIKGALTNSLVQIQGSYFGMLQGRWPLHLLTSTALSPKAFISDTIRCRVTGRETGEWKFIPAELEKNQDSWFELEFNLPEGIANLVAENWGDREAVANIKKEHFSYIDLSGQIGDIQRSIRLELDQNWIDDYIKKQVRKF